MESLLKRIGCPYRKNAPLSDYSSWRIGGVADWVAEPVDTPQLAELLTACRAAEIPLLTIGHGTNLLFDDAGFRGMVVRLGNNFSKFTITGNRIWAQAGVWVPRIARQAGRAGLTGLEHTIGIPGTLGGLVAMNGGSQRKSIGDCVERVRALDRDGASHVLTREQCHFAYRSSILQQGGLIVAEIELCCERGDPGAMRREMIAILRDRGGKFPRKQPNCGSVFVGGGEMFHRFGPPGKVIEDSGLKGLQVGGAQVSEKHANFIVNLGGATSRDALELICRIRNEVHTRTGLWLVCEVRYVSTTGVVMPASALPALV